MDLDEARLAKKRQLSGSPTGKHWDDPVQDPDSSDDDDDKNEETEVSEEDIRLSYLKKNSNKDMKAKMFLLSEYYTLECRKIINNPSKGSSQS